MARGQLLSRLYHFWKKSPQERREAIRCHFKAGLWNRILPWVPLPVRLPWGGWWLAYNDWLDDVIFAVGAEDHSCLRVVERLLQPGMTVFDIGAHHGFYTLLASTKVGSEGLVVAFEPSPRERKRLHQHLLLNRCSNVRVEPVAVGRGNGMEEFFVASGAYSALNNLRGLPPDILNQTLPVKVITLDNYVEEQAIESVDFIKIDVEGAELHVLKGASSLLEKRPRPLVMCEFLDDLTERFGYRAGEIYDFLQDLGYCWFQATSAGHLQTVEKKRAYRDRAQNLFAVPAERLEDIMRWVSNR